MFPDYFVNRNVSDIQVEYVSPGHGANGKQQWLSDDIDLDDMYEEYDAKKEIDTEPKQSQSAEKIEDVRKIVEELKAWLQYYLIQKPHEFCYVVTFSLMPTSHLNN